MKIRNIVASLALSFLVAVGGGIVCKGAEAPEFNEGNFPAYSTTGAAIYCYGKEGTPFYGFLGSTQERCWELEATRGLGESYWGYRNNGQQILNYANSFAVRTNPVSDPPEPIMNAADMTAMITQPVDTKGSEVSIFEGAGSLSGAYMWAPSKGEYEHNETIRIEVSHDSGGYAWTRSYYNYEGDGYYCAWYVKDSSGDSYFSTSVDVSEAVAPAFRLDLTKVLKVKKCPTGV